MTEKTENKKKKPSLFEVLEPSAVTKKHKSKGKEEEEQEEEVEGGGSKKKNKEKEPNKVRRSTGDMKS
jgi:hypothetical protein